MKLTMETGFIDGEWREYTSKSGKTLIWVFVYYGLNDGRLETGHQETGVESLMV